MSISRENGTHSSRGNLFDLGLRWLNSEETFAKTQSSVADWQEFLNRAEALPANHRLKWARLWPFLAALNGVLVFSGLMVWPGGSGVHLLLFLIAFWLLPLLMWVWTLVSALMLGRAPWWRPLLTPHEDRVIALWCGRQALLAQLCFVGAGLVWMWLMLATRQVVFYWSTSIGAVSSRVDDFFRFLTLGVLDTPEPLVVGVAQAGVITGWASELLSYSHYWAAWLSQVVILWVLLPVVLCLGLSHLVLRLRIHQWVRWNRKLKGIFEQVSEPALAYKALQPEQPVTEPLTHQFPVVEANLSEPGFGWQLVAERLPPGSVLLANEDYREDLSRIDQRARQLSYWYIAAHAVPTGDLADLIQRHRQQGGTPRLCVVLEANLATAQLDALKHSWSAFMDRNHLPVPVELVKGKGGADDEAR